ncbi:MAG: helix-turn-helix domain-containing protein [bacterium]
MTALPLAHCWPYSLSEAEHRLVEQALKVADYNRKKAAEILGISPTRLYKKIEG